MAQLDFFFDYVSPFSYLADSQMAALSARTGAEIAYRPFSLGRVLKATGNQPPPLVPARARYMAADLPRWVRRYGIPFGFNPAFPLMKTHGALRAALAAQELGVFAACHASLFQRAWAEPADLGDPAVLRGALEKAGLDAGALLARAESEAIHANLEANTAEAIERGAFGAPTFFVGGEMFFGNDRLHFVEEALRA